MTEHVGFLEQLPVRAVPDGEVAFGDDGKPDFERVCVGMLFSSLNCEPGGDLPALRLSRHLRAGHRT
jgi:hypothetical protein